jgi:hypothetical protein
MFDLIVTKNNHMQTMVVPDWIYDDIKNVIDIRECNFKKIGDHFKCNAKYYPIITQRRKELYWACYWYPMFKKIGIPTIDSILETTDSWKETQQKISQHLPNYPFVRFCPGSPKDVANPVFNNERDAISALKDSWRTGWLMDHDHPTHLFMRKYVNIEYECRCFYHKGKLRAVSGPSIYIDYCNREIIKSKILSFFNQWEDSIPYNSVTIDICVDDNPFVIECNSFGMDMTAGSEHFDWQQDWHTLHCSEEPVFRFKRKFSWK